MSTVEIMPSHGYSVGEIIDLPIKTKGKKKKVHKLIITSVSEWSMTCSEYNPPALVSAVKTPNRGPYHGVETWRRK